MLSFNSYTCRCLVIVYFFHTRFQNNLNHSFYINKDYRNLPVDTAATCTVYVGSRIARYMYTVYTRLFLHLAIYRVESKGHHTAVY